MSIVLMDVYSVIALGEAMSPGKRRLDSLSIENISGIIQSLVLCEKILLEGEQARAWEAPIVCNHFPEVFELIDSSESFEIDISSELQALRSRNLYDKEKGSNEARDPYLTRADRYLSLARKLGVYLSLNPTRSAYLRTTLGKAHRQSASEIAIAHLDKKLGAIEAAKYAGVDISVPAVVEHIMAYAIKNKVDIPTSVNEVRNSKNAIRFRERCKRIDEELASFSGRPSVYSLQKLIRDIDEVASKWEQDLDEGVRYTRREISLRKVWGIGGILESIGLEKIVLKDPIIHSSHADLLFLNDLYRQVQKRST